MCILTSVGNVWKFFVTKFLIKAAQICSDFRMFGLLFISTSGHFDTDPLRLHSRKQIIDSRCWYCNFLKWYFFREFDWNLQNFSPSQFLVDQGVQILNHKIDAPEPFWYFSINFERFFPFPKKKFGPNNSTYFGACQSIVEPYNICVNNALSYLLFFARLQNERIQYLHTSRTFRSVWPVKSRQMSILRMWEIWAN